MPHNQLGRAIQREYVSARFELAGALLAVADVTENDDIVDLAFDVAAGDVDSETDADLARRVRVNLSGTSDVEPELVQSLSHSLSRFDTAIRSIRDYELGRLRSGSADQLAEDEQGEFVTAASALLASEERMQLMREQEEARTGTAAKATIQFDVSGPLGQISQRLFAAMAAIHQRHPIIPAIRFRGFLFLPKTTNSLVTGFIAIRESEIMSVEVER